MRKLLLYAACAFIFSGEIKAQAFLTTAGGSANDMANCIAQTTDGGFIMAGDTYSFGLTESDILIAKFDGNGNLLWNKRYGGSNSDHAYCITATTDGGCAVSGVSGGNQNSLVVLKLDAAGNLQWSKSYKASDRSGSHSIKQTPEGGFVIGGYAETDKDGSWGYVLKTDASGNPEWSKLIFDKSFNPEVKDLTVTKDSGYALVANQVVQDSGYDIFLIKLDKNGNFSWAKSVGGSSTDVPAALIETHDGGFAVTGSVDDLESTPQYHFMYVLRTDKSGNFLFSKRILGQNTDVAKGIAETVSGSLLITGSVNSSLGNYTNPLGCKINYLGGVEWTRTVLTDTSFSATQIINTNTNGFAASGYAGNSLNQDFLISRFDSNFKICSVKPLSRAVQNFGKSVDRKVKVTDATTTVSTSSLVLNVDGLTFSTLCLILPVKLVFFTATPDKNNTALLQWKTAEETNTSTIEVLRSNDGKNYSKLMQLAAKGAEGGDYSYVDNSPLQGKNFYKLKFVDKDGKYSFSEIRTVDINKVLARLFPNPAKDMVNLKMNDVSGNVRVQIYTSEGKLVIDKSIKAQNNSINTILDVRRLAAGTYNVNIISDNTKTHILFVKQ